ncbi:MAG: hypothetical protein ACTSYF_00895 [Promethearchaeota archaeon]
MPDLRFVLSFHCKTTNCRWASLPVYVSFYTVYAFEMTKNYRK